METLSILQFLLLINLLYLAWEDWQYRTVSLYSLGLLAILGIGIAFLDKGFNGAILNVSFVGFQMVLLIIIFSIKNKQFTSVLGTSLGWGDIVFILIAAIWMPSLLFISSYMLGLIGTLLTVLLMKNRLEENYSIPLVSGLALSQFLCVLLMR